MHYVKTETPNYEITTSYVSEKQARRYGGYPIEQTLQLIAEDESEFASSAVWEEQEAVENLELDYCHIVGTVRTVFHSKRDAAGAGNFLLYIFDGDDWKYTGIFFDTMSNANQAIKGPLSGTFNDMLIVEVEKPVVAHRTVAQTEKYLRDNPPNYISTSEYLDIANSNT